MNTKQFRAAYVATLHLTSDAARIDALTSSLGVSRDIAKRIYFNKVLPATSVNVGYQMLLTNGPKWPINKAKRAIVVFGRDVAVFNY